MKKIIITVASVSVFVLLFTYIMVYISVNDEATERLSNITAMKTKVETSLDNMNKTISQKTDVTKGETKAFLEFQALVADSKKGQSIGGMMTQIQEKYPDFNIKGFSFIMRTIEIKRDEFELVQNQYNDKVAQYNSFINKTINSMMLKDKHVTLEQFVVSSKSSKNSMVTGEDEIKEIKF